MQPDKAKELADHHRSVLLNIRKDMKELMTEGILTEEFLVEKKERILDVLREVNNSLKWILLHRRTTVKKVREVVLGSTPNDNQLLAFLLTASELEYKLKRMFTVLVESKEGRWSVLKESIIQVRYRVLMEPCSAKQHIFLRCNSAWMILLSISLASVPCRGMWSATKPWNTGLSGWQQCAMAWSTRKWPLPVSG